MIRPTHVDRMQRILTNVAIVNEVAPACLEFVNIQDGRHTSDKLIYHFNIQDSCHPHFRSVVSLIKK